MLLLLTASALGQMTEKPKRATLTYPTPYYLYRALDDSTTGMFAVGMRWFADIETTLTLVPGDTDTVHIFMGDCINGFITLWATPDTLTVGGAYTGDSTYAYYEPIIDTTLSVGNDSIPLLNLYWADAVAADISYYQEVGPVCNDWHRFYFLRPAGASDTLKLNLIFKRQ